MSVWESELRGVLRIFSCSVKRAQNLSVLCSGSEEAVFSKGHRLITRLEEDKDNASGRGVMHRDQAHSEPRSHSPGSRAGIQTQVSLTLKSATGE